ncbi:MAG TPA: protein kinase [Candidatus Sulfomarinibacteraceae bacterium]|nr:protein kinase [Candidatus Sulfomarinibacteraceae bacterium]
MSQNTWIGKKIGGRYEILELLGQGGMSAVYKAMDQNLKRVVAVKLIHPHLSDDPEFVRRFEEEAKAVAQLRHPNIVQIFDFDHDGDVYYIVFEFVPGETLQDRLKRLHEAERRMDVDLLLRITGSLTDALNYAHSRGLVHRDVKPANVMLNVSNEPVLMDFGIVKIVGGTQHTATGAVMGTARYMSPEQIRGERVDERTDLYSLGVMLFEMAGGRAPFEADSAMTVMMMHVNDPVPDLRQLRPEVPADLVSLINRTLAKNPDERFATAGALAEALKGIDPHASPAAADTTPSPTASDPTIVEPPVSAPRDPVQKPVTSPPSTGPTPAAQPYGVGAAPPPADTGTGPTPGGPAPTDRRRLAAIGAVGLLGVLLLVCVVGGGILLSQGLLGGGDDEGTPVAGIGETPPGDNGEGNDGDDAGDNGDVILTSDDADEETPTSTPTPSPTVEPTATNTPPPTNTSEPTETPAPTLTPTPTVPPGPYSQINNITIEGGHYIVEYETFEFTETLPGTHVHFFFDTVPPDQAGVPGSGPWILYGGPRPFRGYTVADRPAAAEQMCILVANADHSVEANSGNCHPLPDPDS